jgi:hypothetical protein
MNNENGLARLHSGNFQLIPPGMISSLKRSIEAHMPYPAWVPERWCAWECGPKSQQDDQELNVRLAMYKTDCPRLARVLQLSKLDLLEFSRYY